MNAAATPAPRKLAAIVVHDVAPATWPQCMQLLAMIDALGAPPVTLLVVPHFHRGIHARDSQAFVAALTARVARGDELALHGYYHVDDGPRPRSLRALVARRVLTRGEAEFAAIDAGAAQQRLADGIALFDQAAWPLAGFVPPAWQLNAAARRAVDAAGSRIAYVPVRSGIYRLPGWRFESTANLCYSPDRRWRRALSRASIGWELARHGRRRLLRLSLHPLDAGFPGVMAHWQALIERALRTRQPVTKREAMVVDPQRNDTRSTAAHPLAA
ncbi:MAG TPA: polysaccharide deacetylase family protein [Casimicrobiaceae bacterium]|nr:polysaccharide deacetylase family protein [Casimicrobiaceae bacterium]